MAAKTLEARHGVGQFAATFSKWFGFAGELHMQIAFWCSS
jgi:hypothetical protein